MVIKIKEKYGGTKTFSHLFAVLEPDSVYTYPYMVGMAPYLMILYMRCPDNCAVIVRARPQRRFIPRTGN